MTIDLIAIGIVVLLGVLGWFSGALSQLFRVGAVVAAFFGAAPVARLLKGALFPKTAVSAPIFEGLLLVAAGVLVYLGIALVAWLFVRAMWAASEGVSKADRTGGLVLGLLKGVVMVYFLVSALSIMQGPLQEFDAAASLGFGESRLLSFVDRHNLLVVWRFGDLERLHRALEVSSELERIEGASELSDAPDAKKFLQRDSMQRLARRDELVEAAAHDRYYETLADATVRKCLNDDRFVARLRLVDWKQLLELVRNRRGGDAAFAPAGPAKRRTRKG